MSKRTAKFVSAIFASLLAGAPFVTDIARRAGRGRQLSLRAEGRAARRAAIGTTASTAPPSASAGTSATQRKKFRAPRRKHRRRQPTPLRRRTDAGTQRSIANARAELPLPQTARRAGHQRVRRPAGAGCDRGCASASEQSARRTRTMPTANDRSSRRAGLSWRAASSSARSCTVDGDPAARPQQTAEAAPPPAVAAVTLAAADASAAETIRLGPDAADRHDRRTGAGGPDGERDLQVRRQRGEPAGATSAATAA